METESHNWSHFLVNHWKAKLDLWDEPNVWVWAEIWCSWPLTASTTSEVKNDHAHGIMQNICNKFIEIKFSYYVRYLFSWYHPPLFENQHTPLISLTGHFALRHPDTYQFSDKTFSGQVYQKYRVWLLGLRSSHHRALWPGLAPTLFFGLVQL